MALCLGLMSGTSMDGIDAAVLDTDGRLQVTAIGGSFFAYPPIFQTLLKAAEFTAKQVGGDHALAHSAFPTYWPLYLQSLQLHSADILALEQEAVHYLNTCLGVSATALSLERIIACSAELHRIACQQVLQQLAIAHHEIEVIGYHGQTLYHNPQQGISWQAGNAQYLANGLGCPVIANFRHNDILHGGQGAPLTPLYHHALVNAEGLYPAAIINCGGITNISIVVNHDPNRLLAFDAGPGNVLLDRFIRQRSAGQFTFDCDGQFALQGHISSPMLALLKDTALPATFLQAAPPKSLDSHDCQLPEAFDQLSLADGLATLAAFTAECLVISLYRALADTGPVKQIILAGGGWYHPVILREFKRCLTETLGDTIAIVTAKQIGWQQDLLEAEAFAYLAKRSLLGLPLSMPLTTGVSQAQSGGQCFFSQ